jgi:hypothetical protein
MIAPRPGAAAAALVLVAVTAATPAPAAKSTAPYRVALDVRWGRGAGSDEFRTDLAESLAAKLAADCFAGVSEAGPDESGADLVLTVVLSDVADETRFDDTIAGTLQPGDPTNELRREARFAATVDAKLATRVAGEVVATKHFIAHVVHRPIYVGEDPQATARAQAIDGAVRDLARGLSCGSDKLDKKIREALARAVPAPAH